MSFSTVTRTVSDEMSTDVVWIAPEDSLLDALKLMELERVTAIPVVDEWERCVGIVSSTDLIPATRQIVELVTQIAEADEGSHRESLIHELTENGFVNGRVADLMRQPAKSVSPDAPLDKAGRQMLRRRIHHLPVTNHEQELSGIISTMDLLAAFVKAAAEKQ